MARAASRMSAQTHDRILIRNALVLSMDPAVGDHRMASILVEDGRIAAVGASIRQAIAADDTEVIDGRGLIALPGFVDGHRHVWQSVLSMLAADSDLESYFAQIPGRLAPVYDAEDVHIATLAGALQALDAGITTVFDWSHIQHTPAHSDAAVAGLKESGIRAVFGYGFPNTGPEWSMDSEKPVPEDVRRVRRALLPSDDGLVTMAMALRGPEQSTLEVTAQDLSVARDLGLRVSMHVGNGAFGLPYKSIERMHAAGLLGPDIQHVHGNSLTDESIRRIADSGGSMVATPTVELQMQFGYPAIPRFLMAGVRPGLGVDVVTMSDASLFPQMAAAFQAARLQALESGTMSITARDVLGFATLDGARSLGLDDRIGSLTPGKAADIVLLRPPSLAPLNDPIGAVVLGSNTAMVDAVLVEGQVKKRDGVLCGVDVDRLNAEIVACRDRLIARAGVVPPVAALG